MYTYTRLIDTIKLAIYFILAGVVAGCGVTTPGVTATSRVTATPAVTALSITPQVANLQVGFTAQFEAFENGTAASGGSVAWSISDATVATINAAGMVTALAPGSFTVTATSGSSSSSADGKVVAPPPVTTTGYAGGTTYPIPVYSGKDLTGFPTFTVSDFSASGSSVTVTCQGSAQSSTIACDSAGDFAQGQGIRIVGAGHASVEATLTSAPLIDVQGNGAAGAHTYCYVVDTVDPLGAISEPSPQTCVANLPDLGLKTVSVSLSTTTSTVGPSPCFLWYVSEDGGPFQLLHAGGFRSGAIDAGQRIGSRGGWPDNLPFANPSIMKHEDLFSTVLGVDGHNIMLADQLPTSVVSTVVDHDDTQAVENAILAGVKAGGGNVIFGPGSFNLRRPVFPCLVNRSYSYPTYSPDITLDPWWAVYSYLYIPNGSVGNINLQGTGRTTTLITPPDHGGLASLIAIGNEQREGAINTPILAMEDVPAGSMQITLKDAVSAASFAKGDDVFIYSGTYQSAPDVDTGSVPDMNHYTELNTVASVSGKIVSLVYPTSKHYHDDGGSSWGIDKMPITPHDIEVQHLNVQTYEPITGTGDLIGMLVDDIKVIGVMSNGAFGGGYKRGVTIQNSEWSFGQGTSGWGQTDEYDDFTDLAFLNNRISGYAAPFSEMGSGMAKIYATEGTSQILVLGNTFNHASFLADQTNQCFIIGNSFLDGVVAVGEDYELGTSGPSSARPTNFSFRSFDSQIIASIDHNSFTFTPDFAPDWIITMGDFKSGNISDNTITFNGAKPPAWVISSSNGSVTNNTITIQIPATGNIIDLVPDQSPDTAMSSFTVQGNTTVGKVIKANIMIADPGFSDTAPVCVSNNVMHVTQGVALEAASSIINQKCP